MGRRDDGRRSLNGPCAIRELTAAELGRIREIDRSEHVDRLYVREQNELRPVDADLDLPNWDEPELAAVTERLAAKLAAGGVAVGALEGDRLVGLAVLGGERVGGQSNQLELAFLYVDSSRRGRGIGAALLDETCRRARECGAAQLYVSASDTESSIRFYVGHGWRPADHVDPALAASYEPTDIALTLDL